MIKKPISWLLAAAMTLSLLGTAAPVAAAADYVAEIDGSGYETLGDALDAASLRTETTIILLADITYGDSVIANTRTVTIDLNSHALTVSGTAGHALKAVNGGVLSVYDADGDGGSLTVNTSGADTYCAYASSGGTINITGTLTATYPGSGSNQGFIALYADGSGSSINFTGSAAGYTAGAYAQNNAVITVDGAVEGTYYGAYAAYGGSLDITGNVTAVTKGLAVEYGGLAQVEGDITGETGIDVNNITGWNIPAADVTGNIISTGYRAISVTGDADIDVEGNVTGCVNITDTSAASTIDITGDIDCADGPAVNNDTGTMVVTGDITSANGFGVGSNSTFTLNGNIDAKHGVHSSSPSGDITINGDITSDDGFGVYIYNGATVTVNGAIRGASTYIRLDYVDYTEGSGVVDGDYMKYSTYTNNNPTYVHTVYVLIPGPVCEVGDTQYSTLDEAVAVTDPENEDDDTIRLLRDITYPGGLNPGKDLYFDLNGHTLDITNDSGAGLTVDNCYIYLDGDGALNVTGTTYGVYAVNGGHAEITSAEATAAAGTAVYVRDSYSAVVIYGDAVADTENGVGVYAGGASNCSVTVYGDVSAQGTGGTGAAAENAGYITVIGDLSAENYLSVADAVKTQSQYTSDTDNYYVYQSGSSKVRVKYAECKIGSVEYDFFADALADAGDGDTITLLAGIRYLYPVGLTDTELGIDLDSYTLQMGVPGGNTPGITVDGGSLTIDETGGGSLNVITGVTAVKVLNGGTARVSSITNVQCGVDADGSGSFVTVTGNITALVNSGTGLVLSNGAGAHVMGSVTAYNGIRISGSSVTATVDGTITATNGMGVSLSYAGDATVSGRISASSYGVYAFGTSDPSGGIEIHGDVSSSSSFGASAWNGAAVTIDGSVSSKYGLQASGAGADLTVSGSTTTTDSLQYCAWARDGGLITVDGSLEAASSDHYVFIGSTAMTEDEGALQGRYTIYTDGESTVRTKGLEFYQDDFERGTLSGWAMAGTGWELTGTLATPSAVPHSGSYVMKFNSSALSNGAEATLYRTHGANLARGSAYWLEFWMYHDPGYSASDDYVVVKVSGDGGTTWDTLATVHRYSAAAGWVKEKIDLSAYAGSSDVRVAFTGHSGSGNNIFIDDISVSHECIIDGCGVTEAYGGFISSREIGGETYYEVATAQQLAHVGDHLDLNYIQTADIDLAGYNGGSWTPIGGFGDPDDYCTPGSFSGKYLGGGHSVDHLYCFFDDGEQNATHSGIFASVSGTDASVSGLTVTVSGADITNYNYAYFGAIAAYLQGGTIENCSAVYEGDIITQTPNGEAGGIVAVAYPLYDSGIGAYTGSVEGCDVTFASGSILTDGWSKYAGGIAGTAASSVIDCHVVISEGEMIKAPMVGGIAGKADKMGAFGTYMADCTVSGSGGLELFSQQHYSASIGGIAGTAWDGDLRDCDNEVDLTAHLTMINDGESAYAGGIVGYTGPNSSISGCDNTGAVDLTIANHVVDSYGEDATPAGDEYAYAGGITGFINGYSQASAIENCENSADITSANLITTNRAYAGGIVGHIDCDDGENAGVTVRNCANSGSGKTVATYAATTLTGGIAGSSTYTDFETPNILIENCYNNSTVYSESNSVPKVGTMCIGLTAGGVIGAAGEITVNTCYSTAPSVYALNNHDGDAYYGGVVGLIYSTALSQNYYEINANVTRAAGGIVSGMDIVAEDDVSGSYEGASAQSLKTKSFYGSGWQWYESGGSAPDYYSSTNPWRMTSADSYPLLKGTPYTETAAPSGDSGSSLVRYSITAQAGAGGSIDPAGTISILAGGSKTFSVTADAGYEIADVLVDGVSLGAVSSYTFEQVRKTHAITASFRAVSPFNDVAAADWFYGYVMYVRQAGLMQGTASDTFAPNAGTTRAMFVTVLCRLDGGTGSYTNRFTDVASGTWYENAAAWAAENGLANGVGGGRFAPDDGITREQLAVLLYRYAQFKGYDVSVGEDTNILSYNDALSISDYAYSALQWACGAGILKGDGQGNLNPQGLATRAEVAAMLERFTQYSAG